MKNKIGTYQASTYLATFTLKVLKKSYGLHVDTDERDPVHFLYLQEGLPESFFFQHLAFKEGVKRLKDLGREKEKVTIGFDFSENFKKEGLNAEELDALGRMIDLFAYEQIMAGVEISAAIHGTEIKRSLIKVLEYYGIDEDELSFDAASRRFRRLKKKKASIREQPIFYIGGDDNDLPVFKIAKIERQRGRLALQRRDLKRKKMLIINKFINNNLKNGKSKQP